MAIRLTFDILGSTCGDLLRFADAVRAAGARPEFPLQQASGSNRIDVVVDDRGGPAPTADPYRPPMPPPMPPPVRPHPPHDPFAQPFPPMSGQWFPMSGAFPPGFSSTAPRHLQNVGGFISVNWGNRSREEQVSLDTVDRWRAALDTALESGRLDDPTRAALRELREKFSDQDPPGGS
jgi:hypothetical protein